MIAVLSVGNSAVFGCSRTLAALGAQGQGPKILAYVDRSGRPLVGVGCTLFVGLLCFVSASDKQSKVFSWLLALSGLSSVFTWGSICFAHIRFRAALSAHGRGIDELAFTSQAGVYGSWFGLILNILVLIAQFWTALYPIGQSPDASAFFQSYLAAPVILAFWIFYKIWKKEKQWYIPLADVNLDIGRRNFDLDLFKQEVAEERSYIASKPWYIRTFKFWC